MQLEAGPEWKVANPYPTGAELEIVAFNGHGTGVAIGSNPGLKILRTEDGGSSWIEVAIRGAFGRLRIGRFCR